MRREIKGIDVYGGNRKPDGTKTAPISINWKQVKDSGIAFAILRVTERYGTDQQFKRNASRCEKRGIPYGVYRFSYALTEAEAIKEAKDVVRLLKGRKLDYPVFYDLEWDGQKDLSKAQIEAITLAFFEAIVKAGYRVGIYANVDWYKNRLSDRLKEYPLWLASYPADDHGQIVERIRPDYPNVIGWQYSSHGTVPGIPGNVDMNLFYEEIPEDDEEDEGDEEEDEQANPITADDVIGVMRGWIGYSEANGMHKAIVDIYNSHKPLARGYAVTYSDSWCDATVSAAFIRLGAVDLIGGTECGVDAHIQLFKAAGIWIEDGTITPQSGDIICYNWDQSVQPNDGFADHIGIVERVANGAITTIEGNSNNAVRRCEIPVGYGYIRGFARPKYGTGSKAPAQQDDDAVVIPSSDGTLHKDPQCSGKVTSSTLAVRTWAGEKYDPIKSYPALSKGDMVEICDAVDGWFYVRVAGQWYGFVDSAYIKIV